MATSLAYITYPNCIFVQLNQTYWLIPFQQKVQRYGLRRIVHALR